LQQMLQLVLQLVLLLLLPLQQLVLLLMLQLNSSHQKKHSICGRSIALLQMCP